MNDANMFQGARTTLIAGLLLAAFAFSPQSVSGDNAVNQISELASLKGHGDHVWAVAFSPDGRLIASSGFDMTVKLWDVERLTEVATLRGHGSSVSAVAFSPDGRLLASSSHDKTVKLWDVERLTELATLRGHGSGLRAVAFSPNGRLLASGSGGQLAASDDGYVKLWDVEWRKEIATLKGHGSTVLAVAFSPDGRLLASGSIDSTVKLWDVERRKEFATLRGHRSWVSAVAFSPDGHLIASGSIDSTVKLWDVERRTEIAILKGHGDNVWAVAFSPDGRLLASGSDDKTVKLWDVEGRTEIATLRGHGSWVKAVAFSPNGRLLASGSADNTVRIWDLSALAGPPKPKYNPIVEITADFKEPSGNNILEEGETASVRLAVHNTGKGEAYDLQPEGKFLGTEPYAGLSIANPEPHNQLNSGDSTNLIVTVIANEQVVNQTVEMHLQILEANGFDSDPVILRFETRATRPPQFAISEWAIDDDSEGESQGNANLQFELGEIAEVTLRVTNSGEGSARDVKLLLGMPSDPNLFYQSSSTRFVVGYLPPGGSRDITFAISTNKRYEGDQIELSVQFTDARSRFNSTSYFSLPLQQKAAPLTPIDITPIAIETGAVEVLAQLTSLVDTDIPTTGMDNPDAVAVIIGNSNYEDRDIPPVEFAGRDAAVMKEYLIRTLGYDERNVLYYSNADLNDFSTVFGKEGRARGRLYDYVKPDRSDVFIYYSGHGAPDPETKQAFLLPSDCDRNAIPMTAFNRNTLFENLALLQARSITVVLDACFSGMSDAGSLMGDISPIVIEVEPSAMLPNGTVFSSSAADQVSTWYREQKHGLFTYFFLMGLRGEADTDGDRTITVGEMEKYLTDPADGVPYWARRLKSREQMPVIITEDKNKVVVELK